MLSSCCERDAVVLPEMQRNAPKLLSGSNGPVENVVGGRKPGASLRQLLPSTCDERLKGRQTIIRLRAA